ncbi:MAG: hypothetical protein D6726_08390 [Nitrospirae bacterium]|nr:MAG: hypothetical protein D6726_08390 [Nitrospirota bacterium]
MKRLWKCIPVSLMMVCFFMSAATLASHNEIGKVRCLSCHVKLPFNKIADRFTLYSVKTCRKCHNEKMITFDHPVGIRVKKTLPPDLPLSEDGRMICITCHTFHRATYLPGYGQKTYLRRGVLGKRFCLNCHKTDPLKPLMSKPQ